MMNAYKQYTMNEFLALLNTIISPCIQCHWSLMNSVMHMVSLSLFDAIITDNYYGWNVTAQHTSQ